MKRRKPSIERYSAVLETEAPSDPAVIFLCGPSKSHLPDPSAALRVRMQESLERAGFEVVLGEDDGLEELQSRYGYYAHSNEWLFVSQEAFAIVLVAHSVGSFCELGMFADRLLSSEDKSQCDFILIANRDFENHRLSYFYKGPAQVVKDHWIVFWADFTTFDVSEVVERLRRRKSVFSTPRGSKPRGR